MKAQLNLTLNNPWYFAPSFEVQNPDVSGFMKICATLSPKDILLNVTDSETINVRQTYSL